MLESIAWAFILSIFFKISSGVLKITPSGGSSNPSKVGLLAWHTPHLYLIILLISLKEITSFKLELWLFWLILGIET